MARLEMTNRKAKWAVWIFPLRGQRCAHLLWGTAETGRVRGGKGGWCRASPRKAAPLSHLLQEVATEGLLKFPTGFWTGREWHPCTICFAFH